MKVYEIGVPDHYQEEGECCDCTIWILSKYPIELLLEDRGVYVKCLENVSISSAGIDFKIE